MQYRTTANKVQRCNYEFEMVLVQQAGLASVVKELVVFDRIGFWLFTDVHVESELPASIEPHIEPAYTIENCGLLYRHYIPILMIFERFRNMPAANVKSDSMSRLGGGKCLLSNMFSPCMPVDRPEPLSPAAESINTLENNVRRLPLTIRNHGYLCVDTKDRTIRPAIISFSNNIQENRPCSYEFVYNQAFAANEDTTVNVWRRKNTHSPLVARAEEALSSRIVNTDRKRKNTIPLLAISPEDALFTRSIRRRYTPATSNIHRANTNRNSLSTNIHNLSSNMAHARKGHHPCFLQLYVYDTRDELSNRMHHFCGLDESTLNPEIIEGLIHVLDEHNGLVRLFRTARNKCNAGDIPSFKIRLYNMGGVRGYELPIADVRGAIVFENGPRSRTDFD
ncbi:hypothetical protein Tco_0823583 [Tanacetum coccineum]|uniref:Uncharacterized protein n=1 Tax=Tanacetum coccineum TaxID=301880 RepID=A0ABQ5AMY6_9ASTR